MSDKPSRPNDNPFGHLLLNPHSQREEAQKREADRRAGRGRKNWWKEVPVNHASDMIAARTLTRAPELTEVGVLVYDKKLPDGTLIEAPSSTYRVLNGVPVVFQLAEWAVVIAGFQYVDQRFGFVAAKVAWIILAACFAVYLGTLSSNVLWRTLSDPYRTRPWKVFSYVVAPICTGGLTYGLYKLIEAMVASQQAA
jgi:hypothetical protein